MINSKLLKILSCPYCQSPVKIKAKKLFCANKKCHRQFDIVNGIPIFSTNVNECDEDLKITLKKWEKTYQTIKVDYDPNNPPKDIKTSAKYTNDFFDLDNVKTNKVFLEAGCGTARTALEVAKNKNLMIICLDISLEALLKAKALFKKSKKIGCFIQADLRLIPLKTESVDFIFSDGAIEHFRQTKKAVNELYRILNIGGRVFATVPYASLSMMTYGQLQGNIPNIFLVRNILEFFHINLMKGKLCKHGYELSFTQQQMKKLCENFDAVKTGHFNTYNEIRFINSKFLKKLLRKMSTFKPFWPLIYVYAEKGG